MSHCNSSSFRKVSEGKRLFRREKEARKRLPKPRTRRPKGYFDIGREICAKGETMMVMNLWFNALGVHDPSLAFRVHTYLFSPAKGEERHALKQKLWGGLKWKMKNDFHSVIKWFNENPQNTDD